MPVKVLVVDDSSFFRKRVSDMLEGDARFKVIGVAKDGNEAITKTKDLKPDVITMDVEMPVMDGITAVKRIMSSCPTPILMFSSLTREGAQATFEALDAGAVDYLPKNFEDISKQLDEVARVLRARVWGIGIRGLPKARKAPPPPKAEARPTDVVPRSSSAVLSRQSKVSGITQKIKQLELIAIGSSTGGPVAVQNIMQALPENFPVPILLVQHMPQSFTAAFAERMNKLCEINVREAKDGDILKPGSALLAPGGQQLKVLKRGQNYVVKIEVGDVGQTYRPCIDLTFSSIAKETNNKCLGIILTGMGADGREGAKELKSKGSTIWAQDEASSVIYGMPMAIAKAGLADKELSLEEFAPALIKVA